MVKNLLARRTAWKWIHMRAGASFTVESAVIIPVFTFIILAMTACGFYVRNTVMIKALTIRQATRLGQLTDREPDAEALAAAGNSLKDSIKSQGVFLKDVSASACFIGDGKIRLDVYARPSYNVGGFSVPGNITYTYIEKMNNPAMELRKWHAMKGILHNS